jgi:putative tryptophan/tyrosine transport system substrate-binding protein
MVVDIGRRRFIYALGGSVATWPLPARALDQSHIPKVGVLWHAGSAAEEAPYFDSLIEGFSDLGYVEGRIILENRFPDEKPALFKSMAAELVSSKPDVLIAVGAAAPYAEQATATIPIVFMYVPDPLGSHLVESIRRPGRNATGLSNFSLELCGKRLEYLKEIVPSLSRVALLINPSAKVSDLYIEQSDAAAPKLGLKNRRPKKCASTCYASVGSLLLEYYRLCASRIAALRGCKPRAYGTLRSALDCRD